MNLDQLRALAPYGWNNLKLKADGFVSDGHMAIRLESAPPSLRETLLKEAKYNDYSFLRESDVASGMDRVSREVTYEVTLDMEVRYVFLVRTDKSKKKLRRNLQGGARIPVKALAYVECGDNMYNALKVCFLLRAVHPQATWYQSPSPYGEPYRLLCARHNGVLQGAVAPLTLDRIGPEEGTAVTCVDDLLAPILSALGE